MHLYRSRHRPHHNAPSSASSHHNACFCPHFFSAAQGNASGGGNVAKHGSISSAVAAKLKLSQKVSAVSCSSTSGDAGAATAAAAASASREIATDGGKVKNNSKESIAARRPVKGAPAAGKKGIPLNSSGGVETDAYVYAESLAFLSSPPEQALKGVGPKRGEQLAKLGRR